MKTVLISESEAKKAPADLLIAGFFEKEKPARELESLEPAFIPTLRTALAKSRFEGKSGEFLSSYVNGTHEVAVLGLGEKKKHKPVCFRRSVGQILQIARARKARRVRILLATFAGGDVKIADAVELAAEVAQLSFYDFDRYKSKKSADDKKVKPEVLELLVHDKPSADLRDRLQYAETVAAGTMLCRDLINEPANIMTPEALAAAAKDMARKKSIKCQILGEAELKRLKMGGILGVNQGSVTPPAFIVLEYGQRYKRNGTVCLVGKGVTFDTGGISIKPAKDMEKMKYDMSGAACVIATIGVAADLKLPVHVVALAPAVENNVAKDPQRPGDIIRMYNGKTVEVLNTDAEGRLILGDALAYSEKFKPAAIIDLATLTGMCAATFGDKAIGLMTNDAKLAAKVTKSGEDTGERCWELPMWDDYAAQIKGHHSDLYNIGGPYGGTITAAMFLKEFVPAKTPWVHLDIAGTAWCDSPRFDAQKGATGVGVKLLSDFLSNWKK